MLIYASLADYLLNEPCKDIVPRLRGSDRPFLVLNDREDLSSQYHFLMEREPKVYEIGFPWVQVSDWEQQRIISQRLNIGIETGETIYLDLVDEVLDETQVSNDEIAVRHLQDELEGQCDRTTAETIALFISLFDTLLGDQKHTQQSQCSIINIPGFLAQLSREEARLPLVLALNRRYELRHKLEMIAPKLRSQLNRTAEMMPLGHIQEMDAYCLRDYVRRPGKDAVEKAGARQELMGVQRYQNFNTPENRFLKGFCDLLHLDCNEYRGRYEEARVFEQSIDRFRQEPSVQTIPRTTTFAVKPNYVLQQNPIYRSFYQAYLDYLKRRTEKESIWSYRQALLIDVVSVLLVASLLNLEGSYIHPTASVHVLGVPNCGRYLFLDSPIIHCVLQNAAFTFEIVQPTNSRFGDLELKVKMQPFSLNQLDKNFTVPIWIFWYEPLDTIIDTIGLTGEKEAISIYLYKKPCTDANLTRPINTNSNNFSFQLPHPIDENLEKGMKDLTHKLCDWLEVWST